MRQRRCVLVLFTLGCAIPQASVERPAVLRPPSPAAVNGTYRGTVHLGGTWSTIWRLQFVGNDVTGTSEWHGEHARSDVRDRMTGWVDGNRVVINRDCSQQTDDDCVRVFDGAFDGDKITGEWLRGIYSGSWEVTRDPAAVESPPAVPTAAPAIASALKHKTKMLVLPLRARAGVTGDTAKIVTDALLGHFDNVALLQTVGQQDLETVLGVDKQKQALGCDAMSCMAELGGALGADIVCYGDIGKVGATFSINLSVVRSSNADVLARATRALTGSEDSVLSSVPGLVEELVRKINR
ncbi:MAG TPA: hypothetical protein VLC93_09265 [Myxococcota bacterium]|nr:hypothetical protein [Myxococcota bacterium]